ARRRPGHLGGVRVALVHRLCRDPDRQCAARPFADASLLLAALRRSHPWGAHLAHSGLFRRHRRRLPGARRPGAADAPGMRRPTLMNRLLLWLSLWLPTGGGLAAVVRAHLWALDVPERWDLTSGQVYTITPQTRTVLASL